MDNEKFQKLVLKKLEVIETIAGDVSELKEGQATLETRMNGLEKGQVALETRMNGLEKGQDILARQVSTLTEDVQEIRQSQVIMENELTEKVRALFDAREVQNDINERIVSALERIEAKVDVLQMETAHLRRVK